MADAAEAPATSATLYAVHKHVASRCAGVSAAFLACKQGDQNPEVCLKQGAAVTGCVVGLCVPRSRPARRVGRRGVMLAAGGGTQAPRGARC
jgi:hypothetical protein